MANTIKKILSLILPLVIAAAFAPLVVLAQNPVNVYFFWGQGCPHCEREKEFLSGLQSKYPQIAVRDFEVWNNSENRQILIDVGGKLNIEIAGVPFTVVGDKHFIGWYDENSTGTAIEEAVKKAIDSGCSDIVAPIVNPEIDPGENGSCGDDGKTEIPEKINVPFLGAIGVKDFSLPVLAVVLGALDGFNPCAMWTLLFLISLLLGMENRKRMWILGCSFIGASALVYFLFMSAWLNLLLFVGFIVWVRIIVALVAIGGGAYNLKAYFSKEPAVCANAADPKRKKVFERLKKITLQNNFYLALGGIVLLAFAVNLVELICSAGLPVIFTQILSMSGLSQWQYYSYIALYILVFMADDLFVFFAAMITLKMAGITTKYQKASHLIGGVLMLAIGLLLIFRPEWLMFG
jgi:thiol-disulfide isomerase/thioredoxin